MTTRVDIDEHASLLHRSSYYLPLPNEDRQNKRSIKLWAVGFALLLLWNVGGPCVYMIRSVNCFKDNSTVYFCEKGAVFPYSEELVITWLATLSVFAIIIMLALQKVPDFLGYKAILDQLKFLPSCWTLMILFFVSLTRYIKPAISAKSINSWLFQRQFHCIFLWEYSDFVIDWWVWLLTTFLELYSLAFWIIRSWIFWSVNIPVISLCCQSFPCWCYLPSL